MRERCGVVGRRRRRRRRRPPYEMDTATPTWWLEA
jgi:hypothetical protein